LGAPVSIAEYHSSVLKPERFAAVGIPFGGPAGRSPEPIMIFVVLWPERFRVEVAPSAVRGLSPAKISIEALI